MGCTGPLSRDESYWWVIVTRERERERGPLMGCTGPISREIGAPHQKFSWFDSKLLLLCWRAHIMMTRHFPRRPWGEWHVASVSTGRAPCSWPMVSKLHCALQDYRRAVCLEWSPLWRWEQLGRNHPVPCQLLPDLNLEFYVACSPILRKHCVHKLHGRHWRWELRLHAAASLLISERSA